MSEFDTLLAKYTEKGNAKIHGALCKCVDKNGKFILLADVLLLLYTQLLNKTGIEMYSKTSGYNSVSVDAAPLREDCVLKIASATKLIASVALLQCVEKGLIGLDEPLTKILPELDGKNILKAGSDNNLDFEPSKNKITARHLLSHTSGLGYPFTNPLLMQWKATPAGQQYKDSLRVTEKYNMPLVFEPGTGWLYGCGLDWAGVVVRRLHNGTSLEDYAIENIWRKVGLSDPFPTFHISKDQEYSSRLMGELSEARMDLFSRTISGFLIILKIRRAVVVCLVPQRTILLFSEI